MIIEPTKGPYRIHQPAGDGDIEIWADAGQVGTATAPFTAAGLAAYDAKALANAHLFRTAPELLALLDELIAIEGPQPGHVEWYRKVVAIIAKARGQ